MKKIVFFVIIFFFTSIANAGDFWKDAEKLYKTVRALDSKISVGMSYNEYVNELGNVQEAYDYFSDKLPESKVEGLEDYLPLKCGREGSDEYNFCLSISVATHSYNTVKELWKATISYGNTKESDDLIQNQWNNISELIKETKKILNKHR